MKKNQMTIKTYSYLKKLKTFEERLEYLKLDGIVGEDTFGFDRYLNQMFYTSKEWRLIRREVITRDLGCDLGVPGMDIIGEKIIIHHMNPISKDDILENTDFLLNPEYLIATTKRTHDIIHYGNRNIININKDPIIRTKNDTCPWRQEKEV